MKKFLLVLCLCIAFFSMFNREKVVRNDELYNLLKNQNWSQCDHDKKLSIIVGFDYIPYEFIELFEDLTGIKVTVDIFDSNEILEAKLLSGGAQYDLVFPTAWPHFSRQLSADIYSKIDKSKIDMSVFDQDILKRLAEYDKDNQFALPYQFGISGIGMNEEIINKVLPNADKHTLGIVFDPKNAEKLAPYLLNIYESADELFPAILAYLNLNPESENEADIYAAAEHLKKMRKYVAKFTSFGFEDLASGNASIAFSTSGDIAAVKRNDPDSKIKFFYPKEGASLWVDVVAIPKHARHINNAHLFLKFVFTPQVIAQITNATGRANAVIKANKYVDKSLVENKDIYPPQSIRESCYIERPVSPKIETLKTKLLTIIKSMRN